jgi:hypothetical protein
MPGQKLLFVLLGALMFLPSCGSEPTSRPSETTSAAPTTKPIAVMSVAPATEPSMADTDVDMVPTVQMVPTEYRHRLVQQLSVAEDNEQSLLKAIVAAPAEHREALAYLIINMPDDDLKKITGDYLLKNVELAYEAREQTAWGKAIPKEIFFNDVLPYSNVNEKREDWRQDYYDRFMPLVKNAKSVTEAVKILNKKVFPTIHVKYSKDKRQKPDQSPYESMKIGYASCTGLTIILSDACRAVGVPARLAGTPLWTDKSGNHTWTEVWDKQWYFVGSAEPSDLNHTWFADNAAKADESNVENRIYATSFEQTPVKFPMVWSDGNSTVSAVDVTGYYTGRQRMTVVLPPGSSTEIRQNGVLLAASSDPTTAFTLAGGQDYSVSLLDAAGKRIATRVVSLSKEAHVDFTSSAN